jgi:peroxiredoxin
VDIGEGRETVQAFAHDQGLTFPILLDEDGGVAGEYDVRGVPTSFFVSRQGVILARYIGPLDESLIREYLDQLL